MKILVFGLILLLMSACAVKPYSVIDGGKSVKTDSNSYNVKIVAIDGKLLFAGDRYERKIEPGFHYVKFKTAK